MLQMLLKQWQTRSSNRVVLKDILRASLCGLALLLGACGTESAPPQPPTAEEEQALSDAEAMIEAGRPPADTPAEEE
ncbi:hypothetical protein ACRAQ6_04630 [Erythrobacter sp. HA6-11]